MLAPLGASSTKDLMQCIHHQIASRQLNLKFCFVSVKKAIANRHENLGHKHELKFKLQPIL
jgi:hypothetical protein